MTDERGPGDADRIERDGADDAIARAIRSSRLGHIAPGETPSGGAILQAMGGVRGIVESLLPGILFLVIFTITQDVWLSVLVPLGVSIVAVLLRVVTKGQPVLAFAGLVGVGISAAVALLTGNAADNFLWGFIVNSVGVIALVASLVARRPLIGLLVGGLTGTPYAWRTDPARRAVAVRATILWICVLGARLAVQVPLYLAATQGGVVEATQALATTRLIMGVPLYGAALWVTWLMVRAVPDADEARDTPASA
ncbi:DUF3159 domain-containing protein [Agrococcus sp. SGAir0287]|uniref:DUF3159 domain-containing protein n=1 Tax=Agrococcus sp. SGAir0287 TaxID=2070347 RepID=UPI0010CCFD39|nr:DUF3159 domain-containing protein [Agrococcus sp. SGAir0287]QCR19358.1 DUF3159 domain-containing protein [Agrococcus sp. SGAir0287]